MPHMSKPIAVLAVLAALIAANGIAALVLLGLVMAWRAIGDDSPYVLLLIGIVAIASAVGFLWLLTELLGRWAKRRQQASRQQPRSGR